MKPEQQNYQRNKVSNIYAANDREYVRLLNRTARFPAKSIEAYMKRFSTAYEATSNVKIRCGNPADFVADLKAAGRLKQDGTTYTLFPAIIDVTSIRDEASAN